MKTLDLKLGRLAQTKAAYTTRRVAFDKIVTLLTAELTPQLGDLVLARVDLIGQHKHIELANGRKANLFPGDEVVVCYGNRYAPDQFEAEIPLVLQLYLGWGEVCLLFIVEETSRGLMCSSPD